MVPLVPADTADFAHANNYSPLFSYQDSQSFDVWGAGKEVVDLEVNDRVLVLQLCKIPSLGGGVAGKVDDFGREHGKRLIDDLIVQTSPRRVKNDWMGTGNKVE